MSRRACAAALLLAGCARYEDFRLPNAPGKPAAVSARWEAHPEPVIARGAPGAWDSVDVLNPSVSSTGGRLLNFYSGFDGKTWHTGLAVSHDGASWQKQGRLLSPDAATWEGRYIAANGAAMQRGGQWLFWYQAGEPPRIGLARSAGDLNWTKEPRPVLETGPRGSWDERGVADPYVIEAAGMLYLFYLGQDRARRQRLGVARSADGVTWWKLRSNPVLELGEHGAFDENGLGEPAVWPMHGRWWMLYTGRDRDEHRRMGLAVSPDGVRWRRHAATPLISGEQAWNRKVVCDATVLVEGDRVRVWFGGGDVAHPAENIHGQIGYGVLTLR